jgi:hypothetical protein
VRRASSQFRNYWLWYIGSGVWLLDAALALHLDHRGSALTASIIALLFLLAGVMWRGKWNREQ